DPSFGSERWAAGISSSASTSGWRNTSAGGTIGKAAAGTSESDAIAATLKRGDLHRPAVDQNAPGAKPRTVPEHTNQLGAGRWVVPPSSGHHRPRGGRKAPYKRDCPPPPRPPKPGTDGPGAAGGKPGEAAIQKPRSTPPRLAPGLKKGADALP